MNILLAIVVLGLVIASAITWLVVRTVRQRKVQEEERIADEQEARRRAEEVARRKSQDARVTVAAEAQRKAAEEARIAAQLESQRRAEQEARLKAEEARAAAEAQRRADEEARTAAHLESQRQAEEEARRKREEARVATKQEPERKAEVEAQFAAEQDARRKAEEEAPRRTEAAKSDEGEVFLQSADVRPEASLGSRPEKPAVHRDRRGNRRASTSAAQTEAGSSVARPPAEARLRLSLHPIRRTAGLSLVLMRPEGFPPLVSLRIDDQTAVAAYDEQRYDDISLPWSSDLLSGELRVSSAEGFQWLRSARRVQIFAPDANEPDLMTVPAARAGVVHAIICRSDDVAAVRAIAESAGSTNLKSCDRFEGIPEGWVVLSEYAPTRAAESIQEPGLRPLDPGYSIAIELEGGLAIWPKVFAEGHAPKITIEPLPKGVSVSIGGQQAVRDIAGGWEAPGWNAPGQHTIDVTPGPSLTYHIMADPALGGGWPFWNAHKSRFGAAVAPWSLAEICGGRVAGPAGEVVFAAETQPTMIALGAHRGAKALQPRSDIGASVALLSEAPSFLLASSGQRRQQGKIVWLGGLLATSDAMRADFAWAAAVASAASRRLPLEDGDGQDAWRNTVTAARNIRKGRG